MIDINSGYSSKHRQLISTEGRSKHRYSCLSVSMVQYKVCHEWCIYSVSSEEFASFAIARLVHWYKSCLPAWCYIDNAYKPYLGNFLYARHHTDLTTYTFGQILVLQVCAFTNKSKIKGHLIALYSLIRNVWSFISIIMQIMAWQVIQKDSDIRTVGMIWEVGDIRENIRQQNY